jgi:DNA-binding transcriptional ArsR family regulator
MYVRVYITFDPRSPRMFRSTEPTYDTRLAKALSHPVRIRALEILNERVASPSDIAKELDIPVANVSYHVNTLLRLRCIEEVELRHVRGAIEHRYRATTRVFAQLDDWRGMPANARHVLASKIGAAAFGDFRDALQSDAFASCGDPLITWTRVVLDDEGWAKVYGVLSDALDAVLVEQTAAMERLERSGEDGTPAAVTIFQHPVAVDSDR